MSAGTVRSDAPRHARATALLVLALVALLLVPVPALVAHFSGGLAERQLADAIALLGPLVQATPLYALPPFILGGGIGCLLYLVLSARERLDALERGGEVALNGRALVASSLVFAALFASFGLVVALMVFRIVG